jgi:hypothetical protein
LSGAEAAVRFAEGVIDGVDSERLTALKEVFKTFWSGMSRVTKGKWREADQLLETYQTLKHLLSNLSLPTVQPIDLKSLIKSNVHLLAQLSECGTEY